MPEPGLEAAERPITTALRVLIVDDEELLAKSIAKRLTRDGHECFIAKSLMSARNLPEGFAPELVLLDLRLPDGSGLELLNDGNRAWRGSPVIVMSAFGELGDAVDAMKQGAADYLKKPLDLDELMMVIDKVMAKQDLQHRLVYSRSREHHTLEDVDFIGRSAAMLRVREQLARLARLATSSQSPAPTALILGETGTGKDLAARLLHLWGPSRERPFVQVDCASLPRELIEAELFGNEKGAYTNAHTARAGLIEAAENGTLFLDEIGELPSELQAKLLHVIERRQVRRLGATVERPVFARFVAGTNRDLPKIVAEGGFRSDLYFRLNVVSVTLPPLRDREEDFLLLAEHYAAQTARRYALPKPSFSDQAIKAMRTYSWPGNVRELKHLVERAVLLSDGRRIDFPDLNLLVAQRQGPDAAALRGLTWGEAERLLLEQALRETNRNVSEAARRLGISRMAMRYRMQRYQLTE